MLPMGIDARGKPDPHFLFLNAVFDLLK